MSAAQATSAPKNYLGHPCELADAIDRFSESMEDSRKDDVRWLAQKIGRSLQVLADRCEHAHDVAELAKSISDRTTDDMQLQALLSMVIDYTRDTCDKAADMSGMVLDALERADFVRQSRTKTEEVTHD